MLTENQKLGREGELLVVKICSCPRCKRQKTLKRLPKNFKCADIICDFCGFLAQVKATGKINSELIPNRVVGAAWKVQKERMDSGIFIPLYIVAFKKDKRYAIYYLSADLQTPEMFVPRKPLSQTAKRAGWQSFYYDLRNIKNSVVRLW